MIDVLGKIYFLVDLPTICLVWIGIIFCFKILFYDKTIWSITAVICQRSKMSKHPISILSYILFDGFISKWLIVQAPVAPDLGSLLSFSRFSCRGHWRTEEHSFYIFFLLPYKPKCRVEVTQHRYSRYCNNIICILVQFWVFLKIYSSQVAYISCRVRVKNKFTWKKSW